MSSIIPKQARKKRYIVLALLLVAAVYLVLPQLGGFQSSWRILSQAEAGHTAAAIGLVGLTYVAAATTYYFLAFKRILYWQMVLVQLAAMSVNRLLPGGVGALGTNYFYLRHSKHTTAQAATVVAINNVLGAVGHGLVVVVTLLLSTDTQRLMNNGDSNFGTLLIYVAIALAALLALAAIFARSKLVKALRELGKQTLSYRRRPQNLILALSSSMVLTVFNVLSFYFCVLALGVSLPFVAAVLVFSFGVGAGTATPTPGGLGGFEAGLTAGLIAYGLDGSTALAIALLYRLISYWLPLIAGAAAFIICERRGLFSKA